MQKIRTRKQRIRYQETTKKSTVFQSDEISSVAAAALCRPIISDTHFLYGRDYLF